MIKNKLAIALSVIMLISSIGITQSKADEISSNTNPVVTESVVENTTLETTEENSPVPNAETPEEANTNSVLSEEAQPIALFSENTENTAEAYPDVAIQPMSAGEARAAAETAEEANANAAPAANTAPAATEEGSVIFVAKDNEKTVKFSSLDELINKTDDQGMKGDDGDKGGGTTKAYFLFWSNIAGYKGTAEQIAAGAKAFYGDEPLRNAFPDGLPNGEKLYATYMDIPTAMFFAGALRGKISINKYIDTPQTMYERFDVKENAGNTYYVPNELADTNSIQLGSEFQLNPYVNAFVRYSPSHYFQPGTAQYYGKRGDDRVSTSSNIKETEYTFVDLHVKIDPRIQLNNDLSFKFKSYSFKPHMILTKDYEKIDNAVFNIQDGNPESDISFNTTGINFAPDEPKHFILRTVMRGREEIPAPSFEDSNPHDMRLITSSENNFTVSKEEIEKIARGEADPLKIEGEIKGGMWLYERAIFGSFKLGGPSTIPVHTANAVLLDYKYNKVTFDKNSTSLDDQENQDLGSSYVIHGKALENDSLTGIIPNERTIGNSMMPAPNEITFNGDTYRFTGWNTAADGSGTTFTELTNVNEDITVYAQWRKNLFSITFIPGGNEPSFNVLVEPNSSISGDRYNGRDPITNDSYDMPEALTKPTYLFKGWYTAADGNGREFNGDTIVRENMTVYAHWVRTTEWVDEDGTAIKAKIEDRDTHNFEDINGYTYVSTEDTQTGVKHIYRKNAENTNQKTTEWVDENNVPLKPTVTADTTQEAGIILGFVYIRTEETNTGVKHIFTRAKDNSSSGGSSGGGSSSSGGSTPNKSSSHNSGGPGVIPSTVVITPTPEPTIVTPVPQETPTPAKPVSPVPKTADNNVMTMWLLAVLGSLTGFIALIYNRKRNNI